MVEESNTMPASRVVRWLTLGALILFAVGLYFRDGLRLPPFGSAAANGAAPAPEPDAAGATPSTR